jgi:hypothetical protein
MSIPSLQAPSPTPPADPASTEQIGAAPTQLPPTVDIHSYRETDEGKSIAAWLKSEFQKARTARRPIEASWYVNLAMVRGDQWMSAMPKDTPGGFDYKFLRSPAQNTERRTINRAQAFVRWECSKFTSRQPAIVSVPGTGEDQDVYASYAAEQAWESISSAKQLRRHFSYASWWMSVTGNGFIKTEWDQFARTADGQRGDIKFSNVTPFNVFVPDLREPEIENQAFVMLAYTKAKTWVESVWAAELGDATLTGSSDGSASIIDDAYLNLQKKNNQDCVIVYEMWVKPGAHRLFPNGGLVLMVEDTLLGAWMDEMPYAHGQFPVSHVRHLMTGGFYADSPLRDFNQLQREYNQLRTRVSETAKKMANLQILAQQGSIVASKWTNETGQVVTYRPGTPPPTVMPLQSIPSYVLQQQDRVLQDMSDITGIRDVNTGNAPAGVTAGTALNYLQEAANSFHTPQFQEIEFLHENIAKQALALFQQYVDYPRKIKTVGADMAFGTILLSGADITDGLDIRVEANSAAPQSQAAVRAQVMDMFSLQLIDNSMALKMLDVNGFQRMQDIVKVAERKAQRENMKMKMLSPVDIENAVLQQTQQAQAEVEQAQQDPAMAANPDAQQAMQQHLEQASQPPLLIPVADFDDHQTHILIHNAYCMGQEFETLPQPVQQQIRMHVLVHQSYLQQQQLQTFLSQVPSDGSDAPQGGDPAAQPAGAPGDTGGGDPTMAPTAPTEGQ